MFPFSCCIVSTLVLGSWESWDLNHLLFLKGNVFAAIYVGVLFQTPGKEFLAFSPSVRLDKGSAVSLCILPLSSV